MKIGVTGSNGFIGKNLLENLHRIDGVEVITFTRSSTIDDLENFVNSADFIFHLAGINRPKDIQEFYQGNEALTQQLVNLLLKSGKKTPLLISSSTQVERDNDYGKSKLGSEIALQEYAEKSGAAVYIYRLPNVFGKWSKPNYNTVIATWCHNISRDIPIEISDKNIELDLVYIDDVIEHFIRHIDETGKSGISHEGVSPVYRESLGSISNLLSEFVKSRKSLLTPPVGRGFLRALYATYLSFLPTDKFAYEIEGYKDERGTFYEFLKTHDSGQFSISTSAPGVTRGNHYHNTKNEKFMVVKGEASIRLRQIHGDEVIEYKVSDQKIQVVEMIPGYTHDISNTGSEEMILLLWANEVFDREKPDTYFKEV
ncbi:NAD-dependent epimerase/dehydratase family protein [uncultured Cocleimonas sp.]|uniref:polysaccharide biosynthesis C-terminal domain-containing protein n=1 Tax=uncultured Cocleimonas sp. TaxID=1051587 RepID=UPI00260BA8AD|nr:NAD-dependent epimerase/dehydratase family protein [uncultured Cocleimonas sp.]